MSSLGSSASTAQSWSRRVSPERAFPGRRGRDGRGAAGAPRHRPWSARSRRSRSWPFSVAYELEIAGLVRLIEASGIPRQAAPNATGATRSSWPAARSLLESACRSPGSSDAVVMGEAEELSSRAPPDLEAARIPTGASDCDALARSLTSSSPSHHGALLPPSRRSSDVAIPAWAPSARPMRSSGHVPDRDRARLFAHSLLRDATIDERRYAPGADGTDPRARPDRRATRRPRGAAVSDHPRSPRLSDASPRGREVGCRPPPYRLERRVRRRARVSRGTRRSRPRWTARASACATRSSARPACGTSFARARRAVSKCPTPKSSANGF